MSYSPFPLHLSVHMYPYHLVLMALPLLWPPEPEAQLPVSSPAPPLPSIAARTLCSEAAPLPVLAVSPLTLALENSFIFQNLISTL